jgi:hypothetical protein
VRLHPIQQHSRRGDQLRLGPLARALARFASDLPVVVEIPLTQFEAHPLEPLGPASEI